MKKILLTLGFAATALLAVAQTSATLKLYTGNKQTDYLGQSWYSFDGLKDGVNLSGLPAPDDVWTVTNALEPRDTLVGVDSMLYVGGPTKPSGYYVGGIGNSHYTANGAVTIADGWEGDFSKTYVTFDANVLGTSANLEFKLIVSDAPDSPAWGTKCSIVDGKVKFFLSDLAVNGGASGVPAWEYNGAKMTEADFLTVTKVHLQMGYGGATAGFGEALIGNMILTDGSVDGIVDAEYASNSNLDITAYDMLGNTISSGKYKNLVSSLEAGKIYVLRAGNNVIKVVK